MDPTNKYYTMMWNEILSENFSKDINDFAFHLLDTLPDYFSVFQHHHPGNIIRRMTWEKEDWSDIPSQCPGC